LNCSLEASDPLENGEFILYACGACSNGNVQEDEAAHGHQWVESLDQETIVQIRGSSASRFLRGFDFVIFQQSPIACELCSANYQWAEIEPQPSSLVGEALVCRDCRRFAGFK
jgi:hypothetical protein